jgi:hypothetical protein
MTVSDPREAARTCFDAWRSRDFDRLRGVLADHVTLRGPLGVDVCLQGLRMMADNVMTDIDVKAMAVDGPTS